MPPTEEDIDWFKSTFHPIPKPRLPDDCVEYSIYPISHHLDPSNDVEVRLCLREVQKHASDLTKLLLKDYIWQREGFKLEFVREEGVSVLRGRTEYGDSIEDEWVVAYLLRELTKKFEDLWVKVCDSDGEFLLIEASGTLPAWLEPEVADNRVWIHQGGLTIIKPQHDTKGSKTTTEKISLADARDIILNQPKRLLHSASIEEEAFYRLRNYPKQIEENMHHGLVMIPRKVAYLLHQKPAYVSPAIESFYLRDPIALRPLQAKDTDNLVFNPSDFVTTSVTFPRVGFAQLKSQDFPVPKTWQGKLPQSNPKAYTRAELGMKLSCGFEMLVSDPQNQDKPAVREIKLLLEDLNTGDDHLPTDEDIAKWDQRQDDEKWLDISFEDLEGELAGKGKKPGGGGSSRKKGGDFGDKAAQENLHRIVSQFEKFLNDDTAGAEGANFIDEIDSDDTDEELSSDDDGEDKEASFNEDQFAAMMREMMGMPADAPNVGNMGGPSKDRIPRSAGRVEELEGDIDDSEGEDIQTLMKRMEDELNKTGALDLDPTPRKVAATSQKNKKKLSAQAEGKGKGKTTGISATQSEYEGDDDVDVNLARNLLESFKSQAGTAGPGGNLMGMMGVRMPRDEGHGSNEKSSTT